MADFMTSHMRYEGRLLAEQLVAWMKKELGRNLWNNNYDALANPNGFSNDVMILRYNRGGDAKAFALGAYNCPELKTKLVDFLASWGYELNPDHQYTNTYMPIRRKPQTVSPTPDPANPFSVLHLSHERRLLAARINEFLKERLNQNGILPANEGPAYSHSERCGIMTLNFNHPRLKGFVKAGGQDAARFENMLYDYGYYRNCETETRLTVSRC